MKLYLEGTCIGDVQKPGIFGLEWFVSRGMFVFLEGVQAADGADACKVSLSGERMTLTPCDDGFDLDAPLPVVRQEPYAPGSFTFFSSDEVPCRPMSGPPKPPPALADEETDGGLGARATDLLHHRLNVWKPGHEDFPNGGVAWTPGQEWDPNSPSQRRMSYDDGDWQDEGEGWKN